MNVVELFSGSGTISKEFKKNGHDVFTIDIRKRKGVCEPDLQKNIMQVTLRDIPFKKVHVIWASPPCDVFSKAGGNFHWNTDGTPKTQKCHDHIRILKKCLAIIQKINPDIFFIENPDGRMKYRKEFVNFLIRNNAMIKKMNYSDYGFGTLKPTNLFTNALDYIPGTFLKSMAHETRPGTFSETTAHESYENNKLDISSKKNRVIFDNLTKNQKQSIPVKLAREIREYCELKSPPENGGKL